MATVVRMAPGWQIKVRAHVAPKTAKVTHQIAADVRRSIASAHGVGPLWRSVNPRTFGVNGRVSIGTDHWWFIEYGTRRHTIRPRIKKALWWETALHPVARVNHPGTRSYGHMRRALFKKRGL